MNKIIDWLITRLLLITGFISAHLSIKNRNKLGSCIGNLLRIISKKRKNISFNNLSMAFPEKSVEWCEEIVKKSYHNLGIVLVEVSAIYSYNEDYLKNYVRYTNLELLINRYKEGNGIILLSGHYGNWELLAYTAGLFTKIPILIIVNPQKNKYSDKIINGYRTKKGNSVISMYNSARTLIKTMQDGGAVALLADQSATSDKDIYIDFFGIQSATYKSPAELALKFNVPVICAFAVRNEDSNYEVEVQEIKHDDLEYDEKGVIELTRRYAEKLEHYIRLHPELWVWQHRRWKHTKE